ncbi:aminotransferase class V-fold PLP-dependent enzyme [Hyalangium rubrum]|uniref:Aminotransferase class V-fold PLP-dependent enzyme n=1 Tax=Hyalangium rubrum TaxID=3103134 RepID=A0ABU5HCD5_9BACT|nr:aminotransferase class V-fold PLP-dependent enzyme [Hyalangium sp. s54d21]MDY7231126.1 aminotransferase class V-fold PLP-dependent enzyme [Hyalangium sp. s54d21]
MLVGLARRNFPGLEDKVFLDSACVSLAPVDAQQAISRFTEMAVRCPARDASHHHLEMDRQRTEAAREVAKLLHAEQRHVALIESTSHGLNLAAQAIRLEPGSNVLVPDTEFMQVAIPWQGLREVEVRPVRSEPGGVLTVEAFERAMDAHTRVVCVSSVQWCTGYRLDMRRLGELCRERRIWLVVDAIHEIGAMRVDVRERYSDFLITGGHKWLNAPFGCGLMVVSDRVLEELRPPSHGYLSMEPPPEGWGQYFRTPSVTPFEDHHFVREARAFEHGGTANYPGAIGLGASVRLLNTLGVDQAEAHIRALTDRLRSELLRIGARLLTPEDAASRSGLTVFRWFDEPAKDQALVERLLDRKIYVSMRFTSGVGGIRVSTHFFNDETDIDRLVRELQALTA